MGIKSNIEPVSNIYVSKEDLSFDKELHKQIRGKKALDILLEKLGGFHSTSLFDLNDFLTVEQITQYEEGMYCSLHGDKEELVFGYVEKNGSKVFECRCYKHTCSMFKRCRPNYNLSALPTPVNSDLVNINGEEISGSNSSLVTNFDNLFPEGEIHDTYSKEIIIDFENDNNDEFFIQIEDVIDPQDTVIKASVDQKMLVSAGPGTGKTHTLIGKISELVMNQDVDPDEIIVLSFSRAAIGEVKMRLSDNLTLNNFGFNPLQNVDIRTFDSFATYLLKEIEPEVELTGKDYNSRISIAIDCIKRNPQVFDEIKHIIIDEVQDLVGVRANLVQTILLNSNCGLTFFGDMCQAIYEYQVDGKHEISAFEFHNWLKTQFAKELTYYSFNKNYRQSEKLDQIGSKVRRSILNDSEEKQAITLIENIEQIDNLGDCLSIKNKKQFNPQKNYAVLCRNNGQVLVASKYFREMNISNTVQRPSTQKLLNRWLGELFGKRSQRYLSSEEFLELSIQRYGEDEAIINQRWKTLKRIEKGISSRLEVDLLIKEINNNPLAINELEETPANNVTISSIHRAKGREYDEVILVDNDIQDQSRWKNISDEVRTNYVGLTRPREKIFRMQLDSGWQRKIRNRRWISTGYNSNKRRPYVTHIEVGLDIDIEITSFVDTEYFETDENVLNVQNYIVEKIKTGDPVKLVKMVTGESEEIKYYIYHNGVCIGAMSDQFTSDLFQAFTEVQRFYSKENEKFYPSEINEIYIGQICSYTSHNLNPKVSSLFSKSKIWNGVYLTGLGKISW